jgi:hypothetical protein
MSYQLRIIEFANLESSGLQDGRGRGSPFHVGRSCSRLAELADQPARFVYLGGQLRAYAQLVCVVDRCSLYDMNVRVAMAALRMHSACFVPPEPCCNAEWKFQVVAFLHLRGKTKVL